MASIDEIKQRAAAVAAELKSQTGPAVPNDLRTRFIDVRSELFTRGIYDPVLVRFDSATAPRATNAEVAEQLELLAQSL